MGAFRRNSLHLHLPKILLALGLLIGFGAQAASIPVINPGFETDLLADGNFQLGASGWTVTAGGTWNPTTSEYPGGTPEGSNTAFLGLINLGFSTGILQQTTGTTFQNGQTYRLTVDVGDRADLSLSTFRVGLWADGVLVSTGGLFVLPSGASDPRLPGDGGFSTVDALVTADSAIDGKLIEIRLEAFLADPSLIVDPDSASRQISFDNVQLQTVPLPSAIYLFSSVLALLGWLRRRQIHTA